MEAGLAILTFNIVRLNFILIRMEADIAILTYNLPILNPNVII